MPQDQLRPNDEAGVERELAETINAVILDLNNLHTHLEHFIDQLGSGFNWILSLSLN